jgi:hypothetical protein
MEAPTGATRLAAVIGSPVRHSLSPVLHNAAFAATGLDWVYVALDVREGTVPDALAGVRALGIGGLSVTMPHKEATTPTGRASSPRWPPMASPWRRGGASCSEPAARRARSRSPSLGPERRTSRW